MPYEYRRLTAEERAQVVRQREEQGFPLHSPPHPFREQAYYLITAANYEHAPIMARPGRCTDLESRLLAALDSLRADIAGWVILPNHYHILVGEVSLTSLSAALRLLHGRTSREWNLADALTGRRAWFSSSPTG